MNKKTQTVILTMLVLILLGLTVWISWAINRIEQKKKPAAPALVR